MTEKFEEGGCLNSRTSLETSILEMASFRPESHVAQQSRRDKLRVQNPSGHHFQELPSHILHLPRDHSLPNHDFYQVPSVRNCNLLYDPATMLSPDMLGFSSNTHLFLGHKDVATQPESLDDASFPPSTVLPASSGFNHSSKSSDAQNPNCWSMNYVSNSGSVVCNQSPSFVGPFSCSNLKQKSVTASPTYVKTGYSGYQDVQSSLNNQPSEVSSQEAQKQYGEVSFNYPSFYPSGLSEVVSTSHTMGSQGFEMLPLGYNHGREAGHGSWVDGGSELLLLPSYVGQAAPPRVANGGPWLNRPVGSCLQWNSEEGCVANKGEGNFGSIGSDSRSQVLSLSLSSHLPSKLNVNPSNERFQTEVLPPSTTDVGHLISPHQEALVSGNSKCIGNLIQNMATSSVDARRTAGPLGPFTGYATILKSSNFLRPARQLLDDFCCISRAKLANSRCQISEVGGGDQTSISGYTLTGENEVGGRSGNSGGSTPSLYSSTEACGEGGGGSGVCQVYQPEFQRKKAKLLYMQGEVCRRYKQYHQQMQMVMSSFETVAGLSAATPYSSLALKSISKHFRCLKNAISEQIRHISNALGEELMSVGASNCDSTMPKLKLIEQCFQKQKTGDKAGFVEHPQPVWRPQRGLPERAVAVLRAWLFEHFLHPYPTDTDKHMLAAQTGLSRNQVSNWFINARVRVWKPMVEEIHMLETMGSPEMDRSTMKTNRNPSSNKEAPTNSQSNKLMIDAFPDEQSNCSAVGSDRNTGDDCSLQKRSKVEVCQIPVSVGAGLMGFLPTHGGLEFVGAGAVSLTLGLRHSAESAQQQQQQQQLRSHFGGNMVHDFVG